MDDGKVLKFASVRWIPKERCGLFGAFSTTELRMTLVKRAWHDVVPVKDR